MAEMELILGILVNLLDDILVASSLLLQLVALVLASRLAPVSGRRMPWLVIAAGVCLLAVLQLILYGQSLGNGPSPQAVVLQALIFSVSLLLVAGLGVLPALFKRIQEQSLGLQESEERYRAMVDRAGEGVWLLDESGRTLYVNHRLAQMLGYHPEEMQGRSLLEYVEPAVRAEAESNFKRHRLGVEEHYEFKFRCRDGRPLWAIVASRQLPARLRRSSGTLWVLTDITARRDAESRARELSQRDPLTGLPNRGLLNDRIAQDLGRERRYGRHLAVLFLDLDGFKPINDQHGHATGDAVLREVARRLLGRVRGMDTVARFGGDEFVVVLADLEQAAEAAQVAKDLIELLGQPFSVGRLTFRVGVSIGIALFPDDDQQAGGLLHKADQAMYLAKSSGGNDYRFYGQAA